ncbi:hypothetical protein AAG570_013667 [Ranatra chinensis]|uniref:Gustatory receptor n=1 Tax=Ranatra chinensis TaxID=642074 RepID=A0ABD0YCU5_9HEMI
MASKRRNMFQKNKTQETTENGRIDDNLLQTYLHISQISLIYCHLGIGIVTTMGNRKRMRRIYRSLKRIDTVLANLGMRFEYDTTDHIFETVIIVTILTASNIFYINNNMMDELIPTVLTTLHAFMCHQLRKHMTIVLVVLRGHFRFIGDRLAAARASSSYPGRIWRLEALVKFHEWLRTLGDSTNTVFAVQSLSSVCAIFCLLTGNAYLIVYKIARGKINPKDRHSFELIFWSLFWANELWQVVHTSKTTRDESKRFSEILYKLIAEDNTVEIENNVGNVE